MSDFRQTILVGRVGKDPVAKQVGTTNLTEFPLAVNDEYDKKKAHWYQCKAWKKLGEIAVKYLKKGNSVMVVGRISLEEYTAKDGANKAYLRLDVDKIVFMPQQHLEVPEEEDKF